MTLLSRLEVDGVTIQRGARTLLGGLTFRIESGEAAALTGGNGAGKTSLLRAIAGFIRPTIGKIAFTGTSGEADSDDARRRQCHLVGHHDGLATGRTAREELAFAVRWTGGTESAALAGARRLGLERTLDLSVRHLSAGQRRRLALARLIGAPRRLWLLDEPLTPLDRDSRNLMGEIMSEHLAAGGMIVAAVHDPLPITAKTVAIAS